MKRIAIPLTATLTVLASPAIAQAPAQAVAATALPNGVEISNGAATIRVQALTDSIIRVRIARGGAFPEDASWAVSAATRHEGVPVQSLADGFQTHALQVHVSPKSLGLTITDRQGLVVVRDNEARPLQFDGNGFTLRKSTPAAEQFYGFGDKTGPFNRRGASYVNWTTDAWGFDRGTDPIYKSIPFYIATGDKAGAYGLFLDNTFRSGFDFAHRDPETVAISADGGPIDYYIIAGPTVPDVVRRYTDLTGKAPLPPRWGMGYQQSRYSYMTATEVRDIAARLRSERIPSDVIWLDIDFQDRNRPFSTNAETFPDLKGLAHDVGERGFRLVAITDLHVAAAANQGYAPYDSGIAGDHFLKNADRSLYVAPVWPGPSVFPDFTRKSSRDWWGNLYKPFVADGIAGFWNDMNEPAIFETPTKTMPLSTTHRVDSDDFATRTATHAELHNVYGMENSRATYDGLLKLRPNVRPFVMTRATFAGGQKFAVTWTGDNNSTWDHLKLAVQQMLNLGLSGISWSGADIPGFIGGASPELATRWYEIAAFTPVFRGHAANNAPRAEPWVDGPDHLAIRRRFIEERYRLLPYFYEVAEQNTRTGDPIMRPTFYDYPELAKSPCDQAMAFTLGRDVLVAPSPKPESTHPYDACMPAPGWYDYWSGLPVSGERKDGTPFEVVRETPRLDRLPVFVRPGAIIAKQSLIQSTSETPQGPLEIHVYPGHDCSGKLYWDDGVSIRGATLRQTVRCTLGKDGIMLHFDKREGGFKPWWKQIAVTIHGWSGPARVRGVRDVEADAASRTVRFTIPDQKAAADFVLSRF
ncbi:glycoside hydrolase family 31 protein [Sphingomonas daechungensis]|uniref:glycoside hydrolase family 31 protein n=1 Tax=Sphingomonas daechungensis TaxID=1176646 RepID=UPI0031EEA781